MDHISRAQALQQRAANCRSSAKETTSSVFQKCYRLLAEHYVSLAKLEDDYAAGSERLNALARQRDNGVRPSGWQREEAERRLDPDRSPGGLASSTGIAPAAN